MASDGILSELIDERCWDGVVARLASHPQDASQIIRRGNHESLPLHEASKLQPPPRVVDALLKAHGPAVCQCGQWNLLPLHIAARSNSIHAVTRLLEAFPRGARLKEENGKLPLHLACECNASPDVIEKLLTVYPEGMFVRDNDGKSPVEYAKMKAGKKDARRVMAALERGRVYCAVSKAAFFRVKEEFDDLMRGTVEAHNSNVLKLERIHAEEIDVHRQLETGLQNNLKATEDACAALEDENDGLNRDMKGMRENMSELENSEAALQERSDELKDDLKVKTEEVEETDASLLDVKNVTESLMTELQSQTARNVEQVKHIAALKQAILSLSASVTSLTVSQTSAADEALEKQMSAMRFVLASDGTEEEARIGEQRALLAVEMEKLEGIYLTASA